MIKKNSYIILLIACGLLMQSCGYRLMENITFVKGEKREVDEKNFPGKEVEGDEYFPYMLGYNIQGAIDEVFENAGDEYDMLINTNIEIKQYYFIIYFSQYVVVKGKAVNSKKIKEMMGEEKFAEWLSGKNVIYKEVKNN